MDQKELDVWHMQRALELAALGEGFVEPNPMVGCVIARGAEIIGEGYHRRFGEAHAEVEALRLAGERAAGATLYVTLEPCCHHGKTPPCTDSILAAKISRVVAAQRDPYPIVSGRGLAELESAGVQVESGLLAHEAQRLNAPYLKLVGVRRPWVIAKWAMTLDGKIATSTGSSQWISNEQSRAMAHRLRGRVDAVIVGAGTARRDDPLLTARPPGPRVATRIVVDSRASLWSHSQLVRTAADAPVLVAAGPDADPEDCRRLRLAGCEVWVGERRDPNDRLEELFDALGRQRLTNVLVEGGGQLLGSMFDRRLIDEVHAVIAPKLVGGASSPGPVGGRGVDQISEALALDACAVETIGADVYLHGRVARSGS